MDKALPKPAALQFARDLKQFSFISQVARNRYRDEKLSLPDASKKVRDIVDEFLVSRGVDPKIPPVPIFSERFKLRIEQQASPRARAEELESAISEHIDKHLEEDPELYERFSEKLEKLLREYRDNWDHLAKELAITTASMGYGGSPTAIHRKLMKWKEPKHARGALGEQKAEYVRSSMSC